MSSDLAIWVGPRPASDEEALRILQELLSAHLEKVASPPRAELLELVGAITAQFPDDLSITATEAEREAFVWSLAPLIESASGPILYVNVRHSHLERVAPVLTELALERGLVVFDPQLGKLVRSGDRDARQRIEEMRRATPEEKARQTLGVMATGIRLKRVALRTQYPDESDEQIDARMEVWLAGGD